MATKRTPIARNRRAQMTPDLKAMAKRLMVLNDAHIEAIRGGDQSFYTDGRHDEMCEIGPEVRQALGILPHEDEQEKLRRALS